MTLLISIIGPMRHDAFDKTGMPLSQHIPNMFEAVDRIVSEVFGAVQDSPFKPYRIITPPIEPTATQEVLTLVKECDIAIADVTNFSPNVVYEIAILNGSGTPVFHLVDKPHNKLSEKPYYYAQDDMWVQQKSFEVEDLVSSLFDPLRAILDPLQGGLADQFNGARRPIFDMFNGAAMSPAGVAVGLAIASFYNFTAYCIRRGGPFWQRPELRDLVIVKPESLAHVTSVKSRIAQEFGIPRVDTVGQPKIDHNEKKEHELPTLVFNDPSHPRGMFSVNRVGDHLIDFPMALSALSLATLQLGNVLKHHSVGCSAEEFLPHERRYINRYFEALVELACMPVFNCDASRIRVLSLEEAIEHLKT